MVYKKAIALVEPMLVCAECNDIIVECDLCYDEFEASENIICGDKGHYCCLCSKRKNLTKLNP